MTENASDPLTATNKTTVIMEKEQKSAAVTGPGLILISPFYVKTLSFHIAAAGPAPGGIASLLGSTASILGGSTFTKAEEKPKLSLKPEDVEKYKAAFNDFDHNQDGHISTKELMFAFRRA